MKTFLINLVFSICFAFSALVNANTENNVPLNTKLGQTWDLEHAKIVGLQQLYQYGNLESYDYDFFHKNYQTDVMRHEFISYADAKFNGRNRKILFFYSRPALEQYDCKACPVSISIFEFEKTDAIWHLRHQTINFYQAGQYGTPPENISLLYLKQNPTDYAIKVEASYSANDSWWGKRMDVFMKLEGKYQNVFHTWLESDAPWSFARQEKRDTIQTSYVLHSVNNQQVLDLLLLSKINYSDDKRTCRFLYQFDGKNYKLSKDFVQLSDSNCDEEYQRIFFERNTDD